MPFVEKVSPIQLLDSPTTIITLSDDTKIVCLSGCDKHHRLLLAPAFWPASVTEAIEQTKIKMPGRCTGSHPITAAVSCSLVGSRFVVDVNMFHFHQTVRFGTATIKAVKPLVVPIPA